MTLEPPALRVLVDEDFTRAIVRGVLARDPSVKLLDVHALGLAQTDDRLILEWAAEQDCVVLTHDQRTMTAHAYDRVRAGQPMPGLVVIPQSTPVGIAIESLLLLLGAANLDDLRDRVLYLPL